MDAKHTPAIFELDEHGEATGCVAFFCSEECADRGQNKTDFGKYAHGQSDFIEGTMCEECGRVISKAEGR